jgi:hypothetical protein
MKRKPFAIKCENMRGESVTKIKRKKLVKVNHTSGRSKWTITNFAPKLNFEVEGLDLHKKLTSLPTSEEVAIVFSKR